MAAHAVELVCIQYRTPVAFGFLLRFAFAVAGAQCHQPETLVAYNFDRLAMQLGSQDA